MGLDCWVHASDEPVFEEEVHGVKSDGIEYSYTEQTLGDGYTKIWYGRKTHAIMDYLLTGANFYDDNCTYISLDHLDIDELKREHTRQTISPTWLNEWEIDEFKELIEALEEVPEDKYIYFYAWY